MTSLKLKTSAGHPSPLGASTSCKSTNFALFSKKRPELCLLNKGQLQSKFTMQQSGDVWHLAVEEIPQEWTYAYEVEGKRVIDPYSRTSEGKVHPFAPFDWQNDKNPHLPIDALIIYELHVKGFGGTFEGVEKKLPYLKELGITAIELMPIFEFETKIPHLKNLSNFWGYNTTNFFSLHPSYGTINAFKSLVRACHRLGLEIYLDVVYNHSDSLALHTLAPDVYFMINQEGHHLNFSGCGNTINCNHPVVQQLILDSLRYFVQEMHIDGYRFDLAPILMRGEQGKPLENAPLIEAITKDPILANTKLIAEAWDPGGLYKLGEFPKRWLEWNNLFRDSTRRFLKGTDYTVSDFATRLCGSYDRLPNRSVNYITCHDGFSLHDLVSYNQKHNEANGENNSDGDAQNTSWNCGTEGATNDPDVLKLRMRQMKNFLLSLLLAKGVPMLLMGDEYGHTKNGNNNTWNQDSPVNYFDWKAKSPLTDFVKKVIAIRKLCKGEIHWQGREAGKANWSNKSRFIAYTQGDLYIAFNAHSKAIKVKLPPRRWKLLIDTNSNHTKSIENFYELEAYSSIVLQIDQDQQSAPK